jgi:hypothetical protein
VKSLVVPAIEFFGAGACQGCSALESVTFTGEDTQIGERAFQNCSALKAVRLPNNLTELPPYIFYGCSALQNIDIPTTVTTIEKGAFSGAGLIDLTIPDGVVSLGVQSGDFPPFRSCSRLQTITFGSNF